MADAIRPVPIVSDHRLGLSSRLRQRPERLAWIILISAFACFCALLIGVALAIPWMLENASMNGGACVAPISGTVRLTTSARQAPDAVTGLRCDGVAGSTIETDGSPAAVTLYADQTNRSEHTEMGQVQLFSETKIGLERVRVPFFSFSKRANEVYLLFERGNVRVTTAQANNRTPHWYIIAGAGSGNQPAIDLGLGVYSLHLQENNAQISVLSGEAAHVTVGGQTMTLNEGQHVEVAGGRVLSPVGEPDRDLLSNGGFEHPLEPDWTIDRYPPPDKAQPGQVLPAALLDHSGNRSLLHLVRHGEEKENKHTEVGVNQSLSQDMTNVQSLMLWMDLKINDQSLSGGGIQGSEYPVAVRIDYTDIYGNPQFWVRGFYATDPEDPHWPLTNGEKVLKDEWYPYDSGDLMQQAPFKDAPPARLDGIRIYASGWNYDAMVDNVKLSVR